MVSRGYSGKEECILVIEKIKISAASNDVEKIVFVEVWYKVRKFKNPVCCSCLMESAAAHRIFEFPTL